MTDRLLLLNIGTPSRLLSITPDGGDLRTLVADCGVAPDGIAIDPIKGHVFWTYMGTSHDGEDFMVNDGRIERADLDGGNRAIIIPEGGTFTPKQMQCDPQRSLIYWCDREGMRVMRARTDGSDVTVLVQTGSTDEDRHNRRLHCVGVAIDIDGGYIYWTQKGKPNGGEGRILRAPLDLAAGADPANRQDIEILFDNLPEPIDLEWEANTGFLYWTDRGDPPDGNTLNRARIQAGRPLVREIVLSGLHEAIGLAIDRKIDRAFVSDLGGYVRVVDLANPSDHKTIFSGHGPFTGIAYVAG
ncbi:hypothetical protein [Telmatospirillum sp.]|uniref:hypothetical protein n=1 Tax=Telmatospirillum sp. TaxID=2079197 RepID=UPI00284EC1B7|nr:hypothetical protein [Telmatospirillum sp.]MDR3437338.1 hypothetical protein [Telmatospirillum sp.]